LGLQQNMMTKSKMPILYSYRRCPYAMRARMALKLADIEVEIREISLREKPAHMLQISPKGTVPVLVLAEGVVIEESIEIIYWALKNHALGASIHAASRALILENDSNFKRALDCYKYPERFPNKTQTQHRIDGEVFLQKLENILNQQPYLLGSEAGIADIAIFPFIRQFAAVDDNWWKTLPYPKLYAWLNSWLNSDLFNSVMTKNPTFKD
jgi:glutathione S-transferase